MRVLLTGANGFLGQYALDLLTKENIDVVAVGRTCPPGFSGNFIQADLLVVEAAQVVAQAQATHLIHMAWYTEHGKYWASPLNLRWVEATVRLVEAFCSAGGRKVVMAGTCAEYDGSIGYCREDDSLISPSTFYGIAKDASRRLTEATCAMSSVPLAWGRIFFPYGRGEDERRLIPSLIKVFKGQSAPFGVNAGAYRDFLHAEDIARGLVQLIRTNSEGAYNISSGEPTRISDLVRLIANVFGADPKIVLNLTTARPGEPKMVVGDNQKLKETGWQAHCLMKDFLSTWK